MDRLVIETDKSALRLNDEPLSEGKASMSDSNQALMRAGIDALQAAFVTGIGIESGVSVQPASIATDTSAGLVLARLVAISGSPEDPSREVEVTMRVQYEVDGKVIDEIELTESKPGGGTNGKFVERMQEIGVLLGELAGKYFEARRQGG